MVVLSMITCIAFHQQLSRVSPIHASYFVYHPAPRYTLYTTFWASSMGQATWHEASDSLGKLVESGRLLLVTYLMTDI